MSRCQVSRYEQTAPLRLPPWLTATAVSLTTFRNGTTPCDLPLVPLMWRAQRAHVGPVVAEAAGELGEQRVFLDRLVDAVEVVGHRRQVARRELRAMRARIEQGRRRAHEVERRQHVVELDRARLAVDLVQRQAHRHAHEECLRQLEAAAGAGKLRVLVDQEIAVVQRLQAEVAELHVARRHRARRPASSGRIAPAPSLSRPILMPCLTKRGKYSAYLVAMSACVASSPSASKRIASSSRRAVT